MWKAMSQVPGTHDKFPISSGDLFTHHRSSFLHSLITGDKLSSQHYWDTWEISWEDNSYFIIGYLWVVGLWGIVYSSFYFLNFLFFYNKHAYYKRNACWLELYNISLTFKLGPFIIFIYKIEQIWKPRISGQSGQSCSNGSSMYRSSVPSVNAKVFSSQESNMKGHTTPSTQTVLRKKSYTIIWNS